MKTSLRIAIRQVLAPALLITLLVATGTAQNDVRVFAGKFTLTNQVSWGDAVLLPGNYTITIGSSSRPTLALVRDSNGRAVARLVSNTEGGSSAMGNALLIGEKGGRLRVYSMTLASLGRVLVYDPVLAGNAVVEARGAQTVSVTLARR